MAQKVMAQRVMLSKVSGAGLSPSTRLVRSTMSLVILSGKVFLVKSTYSTGESAVRVIQLRPYTPSVILQAQHDLSVL